MKTTTNSKNRPGRNLLEITKVLLPLLAAGTLVSCGSQSVGTTQTSAPVAGSEHPIHFQYNAPSDRAKTGREESPGVLWDRVPVGNDFEDDRSSVPLVRVSW